MIKPPGARETINQEKSVAILDILEGGLPERRLPAGPGFCTLLWFSEQVVGSVVSEVQSLCHVAVS